MSRLVVIVVVLLVVIVGGTVWLAGRDSTRQPSRVEKAVTLENLS